MRAGTNATEASVTREVRPEPGAGGSRGSGAQPRRKPTVARVAGVGSLVLAIVLVALIVLGNGSAYTLDIPFRNASGLVVGNDVLIGPARAGTVQSIGLTDRGMADVVISLTDGAAPVRQGTVARIENSGLAAIAGHYVVLYPGPSGAQAIPAGGSLPAQNAYSEVSLDQLFDALDPLTRLGLRGVIRGSASAIQGRALAANRTLHYLAPGLYSTSRLTAELAGNEPAFDGLLVEGARAMQALASRSSQLTQLIARAEVATGAIAGQSSALRTALALLPDTLTRTTTTFAGLRSTLDALDPVVAAAKPAAAKLTPFATQLNTLAREALPTLSELSALIHNPAGTGDLTRLLEQAPSLANVSAGAFPQLIAAMNNSQAQLDYLRNYAPDVVAALANLGQAAAYYDANGHYTRAQPFFGAFGLGPSNELTTRPPSDRFLGLRVVHGRCPGGAMQRTPDGSAPRAVPGCNPSSSPGG
jgi:phospholipid/cholesterol/gamma-HCH transport system substrate-binding protein